MKKSELADALDQGRVLARVLAEDLKRAHGNGSPPAAGVATYTETAPPPGRDITTIGSDGDTY